MHMDNMLFPGDKDRNLLIAWGLGTEASTIKNSNFIKNIQKEVIKLFQNNISINFLDFEKKFFNHPDKPIEELLNDTYDEKFVKIVKDSLEKYPLDNPRIFKSIAPNQDNNITALIISGKEVYHRRETIVGQEPSYRYVLNIYFKSEDIDFAQESYKGGKSKKKRSTNKKKRNKKKTNRKRMR